MTELTLRPEHCKDQSAWNEFTERYIDKPRSHFEKGNLTDFELANAQYLVNRDSFELIGYLTAAKERIRWLSIQLGKALDDNAELLRERELNHKQINSLIEFKNEHQPAIKDLRPLAADYRQG